MSIKYDNTNKLFHLETKGSVYQMKIDNIGILRHLYYGRKVGDMDMGYYAYGVERSFSGTPYEVDQNAHSMDLVPQEYSGAGIGDYRITNIALVGSDGSNSVDFRYVSHVIKKGKYSLEGLPAVRENSGDCDTLEVKLADNIANIEITLSYGVFADKDIITRSVEIRNVGVAPVKLEKAASVCVDLMNTKYDLIHFYGKHCMERTIERVALGYDIHTIASRRGMSSHHHNPFIILCDPKATEDYGDCYGFMLMYSGNHKTQIEVDQGGNTRVVMGIHDENFSWNLEPEAGFVAPEVILTYSKDGLNSLSDNYHRLIRENVCPEKFRDVRRPILINNWEATYFDFDTDKIIGLAQEAKELGIEMLVLDDGWFGERNADNAGLGDWFVNEEKLPGGLKRIADEVNALGLKFGLWFEPEMVNEVSKLYEAHPEWALQDPGRKPILSRNQLVLDMSNPDVQDYLFDCMTKILDGANISYVKWDFNRALANVYSNAAPKEEQGETAHRFILGTYSLLERLTKRYPEMMIEGCAGGGGRFDAGMLYYSPQIWTSDNTDPIARLSIQKGTSYGYPISTMGSHVSAAPNHQTGRTTSLKTRGVVAMSGTFGYELDLSKLSDAQKEEIKLQVADFKKYYWLIQKGTYYRLTSQGSHDFYEAWQFVAPDQGEALLNMVMTDVYANSELACVRLKGLDENSWYQVEGTDEKYTGAALMYGGYVFPATTGDYPAQQLHFIKI